MSARDRYEAWRAARGRRLVEHLSGRGADFDLAEVDREFADVTSGELLDEAQRDVANAIADGRARNTAFLQRIEDAVVEATLRDIDAEIAARVGGAVLRFGKREAPARVWRARLADIADGARRREIQRAIDAALADARGLYNERFTLETAAVERLGYAHRAAFGEARRPATGLTGWADGAGRLLARTESRYRDALAGELAAIGVRGRGHIDDAPRLERLAAFDADFGGERLAAAFALTTEAWRIADGWSVDDVARERRARGAWAVGVRVPGEVALVFGRGAGASDYAAYFGAAGRAAAMSFCSGSLPVERRFAGDGALAFAWEALFRSWLREGPWLEDWGIGPRAEAYASAAALVHALDVRRAAGAARFASAFATLPGGDHPGFLGDVYADGMGEATGLACGGAAALVGTDAFVGVDRLRGHALAVQLAESLRARGGRRYWRDRAVGELLKEIWHTGATYSAEEVAAELGCGPLDPDVLADHIAGLPNARG